MTLLILQAEIMLTNLTSSRFVSLYVKPTTARQTIKRRIAISNEKFETSSRRGFIVTRHAQIRPALSLTPEADRQDTYSREKYQLALLRHRPRLTAAAALLLVSLSTPLPSKLIDSGHAVQRCFELLWRRAKLNVAAWLYLWKPLRLSIRCVMAPRR